MIAGEIPRLAERLRQLKQETGMTWKELSEDMDVSERALYYWASGRVKRPLRILRKAVEARLARQ